MRIAFVCPDMFGHINPMSTVARELKSRGHEVTFFSLPPAGRMLRDLPFVPVEGSYYYDQVVSLREALPAASGLKAVRITGKLFGAIETVFLEKLPELFKQHRIQAVVTDQVSPAGGCVAELLGLPFALAMNALNLQPEGNIPPAVFNWEFDPSLWGLVRNSIGNWLFYLAATPLRRVLLRWRKQQGLRRIAPGEHYEYGWVQISQQPWFFDLPRLQLPKHHHYTGPWHDTSRDQHMPFPWNQLDHSRRLVYASLGTIQNGNLRLYQAILDAVSELDVQLVLSLGSPFGGFHPPLDVPANAMIVSHAPQLQLLQRAAVLITHAGHNTVLEGIAAGVPMLCLPITNDQPGVAERVRYLGNGLVIPAAKANCHNIRRDVRWLLREEAFRMEALDLKDLLAESPPGAVQAADILEKTFIQP